MTSLTILNTVLAQTVQAVSDTIAAANNVVAASGQQIEQTTNEAYLGFNLQENKMYGCAGCNRIFGGMETDAEKKTLKMGNVGCTQMMCRNMDNERAVLQALEKTATFSISKGNKLTLKSNDGKTVMTLKRRNK